MVGILCEKPSAARNFAKALGGMKGTYNGEQYVIANAVGHLYEMAGPDEQVADALVPKYKSWDLGNLPWDETDFKWKLKKKKGAADVLKDIKATLGKCDEIVCGGDVDPSGEGFGLQWEIFTELKLRPKRWSRMYFVDESPAEIQKAFVGRKVIPDISKHDEFLKYYYRSRWDFLSMQFTRIATKCGDGSAVLRQGRLKSAMVTIVGDQLKLVANYKKVPSYQNRFRDDHGVVYTNPEEPIFPKPADVPQNYKPSGVVCDSKTMKSTAPPKMLDLAALSAMLAGKGVKPAEVLATYQKMYESNVVSYPRTEDKTITPEQFNELLPKVDAIAAVVSVDSRILTHRTPRKTHVKAGGAHGANRPGPNVPNSLDELKRFGACAPMIYEILARNYLATLAEDYEYEAQKGHVEAYPKFTGSVSVPKKPGWKAVFNDQDYDDADANAQGLGSKAEPYVHEMFPPKPAAPTMKWLMAQLEKRDVGTGATRTSTYAEVTNEKSKYPLLVDKKGKITMSEFGDMSYRLLPGTHIGDLTLTEQVYAEMRDIAAGKLDPEACLRKIRDLVRDDMAVMEKNGINMRKELGKNMVSEGFEKKEKYEGIWNGMPVSFNRTFRGLRLTDRQCDALCAGEEVEIDGLTAKSGSKYGVVGKLANMTFNGHAYVGVEQVRFMERKGVPASWCGHKFTDDEKNMLESGTPVAIDDAVSKKTGKKFSCTLSYTKRDDGTMGLVPSFN